MNERFDRFKSFKLDVLFLEERIKALFEFKKSILFKYFRIETLEIYIGVLFDRGDNPASVISDKTNGFYSSSKQGFEYLKNVIKGSSTIKILYEDNENLFMELGLTYSDFKIKIGALYGNDITLISFK